MRVNTSIVVLGAPWCTHCATLKQELTDMELPFTYKDIDEDMSAVTTLIDMEAKTIPQVFIDGVSIGGRVDTLKYLEELSTEQ